jgi:hypothetical protein
MAWSNSKIFASYVVATIDRTLAFDFDSDSTLVALYNNSITPDNTVSLANSAYNVGQWANTNEQSQAGQWAAGGVALASKTVTASTTTITCDAADTASGSACTLANVYGCLVYDNTTATKGGFCYNYFGGVNSVTNGTFTVVWAGTGIFSFSVA